MSDNLDDQGPICPNCGLPNGTGEEGAICEFCAEQEQKQKSPVGLLDAKAKNKLDIAVDDALMRAHREGLSKSEIAAQVERTLRDYGFLVRVIA